MGGEVSSLESCSLEGFHAFGIGAFTAAFEARCSTRHLACKPFLVGWYRDKCRDQAAMIGADDKTLCFIVYATPGYLNIVIDHFARCRPKKDFVDSATNELLEITNLELKPEMGALIVNTNQGPPFFDVQTIGTVAGLDQYIDPDSIDDDDWRRELTCELEQIRDVKVWGDDTDDRRKILGCSVHPKYGGWYSYRSLLVLHGVKVSQEVEQEMERGPIDFLPDKEKKRILTEYNLRPDECYWRNLTENGQLPDRAYSAEELLFFTEQNEGKRRHFLELKAAAFAAPLHQ
eukprot:gnl/MRDRNA2_/MRDRNA2_74656_c0_seq1.p1 gnl/MRDRNA2_/MRDRNA2_74656_c0~~gnl/MRDRNA2_/MRDRNA2_74656_c0_seq1.p1  ORF type:complete len:289 (+),score=46.95 gnl/MRDRNA2_/MRDRNA2_74656_c0_seq1:49-915(+)